MCSKILKWRGWTVIGEQPNLKKYVIIAAPHTSNWDFFIFLTLKWSLKLQVNFIGKHTIFVGPVGWFLRKIGGRPVNRNSSKNLVDAIVEIFETSDEFIFALAPEGTRSYKDHWKSGFYYIAVKAKVPIQLAFLDAEKKHIGFGPLIQPCGDLDEDAKKLEEFYKDIKGFKPELFSKIKFTR
ncbi:acyltransferase [Aliikangiella marina]|uniref:Acyltransferase n=1 Tax=Aliikangiella marina TaxID=1712262 RepID=A0A545TK82_9GAMM|nr:acyltransferase [Aliikangiella marina]